MGKSHAKGSQRYVEISEEESLGEESDESDLVYGPPSDVESVGELFHLQGTYMKWASIGPATDSL